MVFLKGMSNSLIFLLFFISPHIAYGQRDIPTNLLSLPVLITLKDGSYGSGFFAVDSSYMYLVTAKHVLFKLPQHTLKSRTASVLKYSITDTTEGRFKFVLNLDELIKAKNLRYHKSHDIAVINLAKKQKLTSGKMGLDFVTHVKVTEKSNVSLIGTDFSSFKMINDVLVANEVIIFGYPRSLGIKELPQLEYDKPLLRKGIVAGINRSKNTIILDCPAYPGNSGGPVIEIDRVSLSKVKFKVIGIVSQFVPFAEKWVNLTQGYSNLAISNSGYSIVTPIEIMFELVNN